VNNKTCTIKNNGTKITHFQGSKQNLSAPSGTTADLKCAHHNHEGDNTFLFFYHEQHQYDSCISYTAIYLRAEGGMANKMRCEVLTAGLVGWDTVSMHSASSFCCFKEL